MARKFKIEKLEERLAPTAWHPCGCHGGSGHQSQSQSQSQFQFQSQSQSQSQFVFVSVRISVTSSIFSSFSSSAVA